MKKNFSAQPLDTTSGGVQQVLTGKDLFTEIPKVSITDKKIFDKRPLFKDECRNCYGFSSDRKRNLFGLGKKDDGYGSVSGYGDGGSKITGSQILDTLGAGLGAWSTSQKAKADREAAAAALELAAIQKQNEELKLKQQQAKSSTVTKYAVPIAITGGVVILGIITYFVFKKKKIS